MISTRNFDADQMRPRCAVCGANPSLFEYLKVTFGTACAFNNLLELAN